MSTQRLNLVGTSGCGKSTLARRIAEQLKIPYVELDELFWKPGWAKPSDEEFFGKIEAALSSDNWVLDGNYTRTRPIKWKRCGMVVYLDLPFRIVIYQVVRRTLARLISGEELWAGNKETPWKQFFTGESIILWAIQMFYKNRRRYSIYSRDPAYSHIKFVRLRSRKEIDDFVTQLKN